MELTEMNKSNQVKARIWRVNTDGAIRPEKRRSGLAAIVRDEGGHIHYWWRRRAGCMTCNEAEYAAAIFALERMAAIRMIAEAGEVLLLSDSQIMVEQMSGRAAVNAPALAKCQKRLQQLAGRFAKVSFQHIPREQNRLADALAFEAVEDRPQNISPAGPVKNSPAPNRDLWDQFIAQWEQK